MKQGWTVEQVLDRRCADVPSLEPAVSTHRAYIEGGENSATQSADGSRAHRADG
jgi:hypothetical protein